MLEQVEAKLTSLVSITRGSRLGLFIWIAFANRRQKETKVILENRVLVETGNIKSIIKVE